VNGVIGGTIVPGNFIMFHPSGDKGRARFANVSNLLPPVAF
jgi:hypothetical protein